MSKRKCSLCGKDPSEGFASINDVFYCHGDFDPEPTCYMQSQSQYVKFELDPADGWPPPSGDFPPF